MWEKTPGQESVQDASRLARVKHQVGGVQTWPELLSCAREAASGNAGGLK